jgi:ribosome biogenesis GTPase
VTPSDSQPADALLEGWVARKSRGYYFVRVGDTEMLCRISNRLRKQLVFRTADAASTRRGVVGVREIDLADPVAVGDRVLVADGGGGAGSIKSVLPRRNKFSRRIHRGRPLEQILAANLDLVVGVFAAARPDLRWDLLDRVVVEAEILRLPAVVVITKMDLADREFIDALRQLYEKLGYRVLPICAPQNQGIDAVRTLLAGKFSLLVGESGAGKTTLLNALSPGLDRRVGGVKGDKRGRGRHTTTMVEAFELDGVGWLVDTPGINDLGLHNGGAADALDPVSLFPELRPLAGDCRFAADCTHMHEPGCAVLEALDAETIDPRRYESYLTARSELLTPSTDPRQS